MKGSGKCEVRKNIVLTDESSKDDLSDLEELSSGLALSFSHSGGFYDTEDFVIIQNPQENNWLIKFASKKAFETAKELGLVNKFDSSFNFFFPVSNLTEAKEIMKALQKMDNTLDDKIKMITSISSDEHYRVEKIKGEWVATIFTKHPLFKKKGSKAYTMTNPHDPENFRGMGKTRKQAIFNLEKNLEY